MFVWMCLDSLSSCLRGSGDNKVIHLANLEFLKKSRRLGYGILVLLGLLQKVLGNPARIAYVIAWCRY